MEYSPNIIRRAEQILGYGIGSVSGQRVYTPVNDVIYVDLYTGNPTIEGYSGSIIKRFNGVQSATYFNEIVIDPRKCKRQAKVTASWGSSAFLTEIKELLDWLQNNPFTDLADNAGVKSKKIEDFWVTNKDSEEASSSFYDAVKAGWSFYIRRPLVIDVTPEQEDDGRYF